MIRVTRRWRPAVHRPPRFRRSVAALLLATAFYAYGLLGGADNVFVTCLLRLIRTAGMKPVVAGELVGLVRETGVKNDLCVVSEEICIERRSCWCKATR